MPVKINKTTFFTPTPGECDCTERRLVRRGVCSICNKRCYVEEPPTTISDVICGIIGALIGIAIICFTWIMGYNIF